MGWFAEHAQRMLAKLSAPAGVDEKINHLQPYIDAAIAKGGGAPPEQTHRA
tara:strand:+ start:1680 stop:1832 length:153 start_codon:yes stop_codon:yes gene_type:complete